MNQYLYIEHTLIIDSSGIWKKHLRTKTNLHATVIDRCIKTLIKKQLIKHVHSVQVCYGPLQQQ
jgi:DNA-directed RNA polymerase III subunit RPC6